MVSVCLPSDAVFQHLPSYLGFSYFGSGVSLHGCSSKVQPLLLTLDDRYLLIIAVPDLQRGMAPLGPPVPAQALLLGYVVATLSLVPGLGRRVALLCRSRAITAWHPQPLPLSSDGGVTPLGRHPSGMGSSRLLSLTSDVG